MDDEPKPPKLLCAWCDLNGGFDEPLFHSRPPRRSDPGDGLPSLLDGEPRRMRPASALVVRVLSLDLP